LALPHRLKRQPFQDTTAQFQALEDRLKQVREEAAEKAEQQATSSEAQNTVEEKKTILRR
jgi:Mg-chelatase subunit ChlI